MVFGAEIGQIPEMGRNDIEPLSTAMAIACWTGLGEDTAVEKSTAAVFACAA